MAVKPFVSVCHRCGTCGTIFRSLEELSVHVACGHSADTAPEDGAASYPAPVRHEGMPRMWRAQYSNRPALL